MKALIYIKGKPVRVLDVKRVYAIVNGKEKRKSWDGMRSNWLQPVIYVDVAS